MSEAGMTLITLTKKPYDQVGTVCTVVCVLLIPESSKPIGHSLGPSFNATGGLVQHGGDCCLPRQPVESCDEFDMHAVLASLQIAKVLWSCEESFTQA